MDPPGRHRRRKSRGAQAANPKRERNSVTGTPATAGGSSSSEAEDIESPRNLTHMHSMTPAQDLANARLDARSPSKVTPDTAEPKSTFLAHSPFAPSAILKDLQDISDSNSVDDMAPVVHEWDSFVFKRQTPPASPARRRLLYREASLQERIRNETNRMYSKISSLKDPPPDTKGSKDESDDGQPKKDGEKYAAAPGPPTKEQKDEALRVSDLPPLHPNSRFGDDESSMNLSILTSEGMEQELVKKPFTKEEREAQEAATLAELGALGVGMSDDDIADYAEGQEMELRQHQMLFHGKRKAIALWSSGVCVFIIAIIVLSTTLTAPKRNSASSASRFCNSETTHVIPACSCKGKVGSLTDEVIANRETLIPFLQNVGALPSDYDGDAQSCDVTNQALLYVSDLENHFEFVPTNVAILQRFVLSILYQVLDGSRWERNGYWLSSMLSECNWQNVMCDKDDKITGFELQENGLRGSLPYYELVRLEELRHLNIHLNRDLDVELKTLLTTMPYLETVGVSETVITDTSTLPADELVAMTNLQYLFLSGNSLQGTLVSELNALPQLKVLDLSNNALDGRLDDLDLEKLASLTTLNVASNQLTGRLPSDLVLEGLEALNVHENRLTGTIPLPYSPKLRFVDYGANLLHGVVPTVYCNSLDFLQSLVVDCEDLSVNNCDCCECAA